MATHYKMFFLFVCLFRAYYTQLRLFVVSRYYILIIIYVLSDHIKGEMAVLWFIGRRLYRISGA